MLPENESIAKIESALAWIDQTSRDIWVSIGMAVNSEFPNDLGFSIWDKWSQQAPEKYREHDTRSVWRSFAPNGKISIATLFHEAQRRGWSGFTAGGNGSMRALMPLQKQTPTSSVNSTQSYETIRQVTAENATAIMKAANPLSDVAPHPYFVRKSIHGAGLKEIDATTAEKILDYPSGKQIAGSRGNLTGRLLVIPITPVVNAFSEQVAEANGQIHNVQLIDETGNKAFLPGRGSMTGCCWLTGNASAANTFFIGEGVATVLTITENFSSEINGVGVCSFGTSNLRKVAVQLREYAPKAKIVILADLDKDTGKPVRQAIEAAQAVSGYLAVPDFCDNRKAVDTDFNDMAAQRGIEAVKASVKAAKTVSSAPIADLDKLTPDYLTEREVHLMLGNHISAEPVAWLWPGWLAAGKLHIIGGSPGTGKTTLALGLASIISRGGQWPDGTDAPAGSVIIWSGEDDLKDTLTPRLLAMDADMANIYFIDGVIAGGQKESFDPARDVNSLIRTLSRFPNLRMIIIDPIVSAIIGDSHKNAEVRRGLQPLADLASRSNAALIGITHFSKGTSGREPLERITGSLAFGALARVVMIAAKDTSEGADSDRRIFARAKSNLGLDDGGFAFTIEQRILKDHPDIAASAINWGEAIDGTAREILARAEGESVSGATADNSALSEAKNFLIELLADAPLSSTQIKEDASNAGYSWRTIKRAKSSLGIEARKDGMNGHWMWDISPKEAKSHEAGQ